MGKEEKTTKEGKELSREEINKKLRKYLWWLIIFIGIICLWNWITWLFIIIAWVIILPFIQKKVKKIPWIVFFLLSFVLIFAWISIGNQNKENNTIKTVGTITETPTKEITSMEQPAPEVATKNLIYSILKWNNNLGKPYLKTLNITKESDNSLNVVVEFNANDNLSVKTRRTWIEGKMTEIYLGLSKSIHKMNLVQISAFFPLMDKYWNEFDGLVYKTQINKDDFYMINWKQDELTLKYNVLPNVRDVLSLHSLLQ